ncbi:uncharacterized protein [Rutidosis leptorrhynchoides]|uniref:uncharacterized protein n=1 Tax=Rutidosis leptorrhynchoides TaxID=125765 RepID=UPI003A99C852
MARFSGELLQIVLTPGHTAQQTWERLKSLFHDNEHSRSVQLQQHFSNIRLDNFTNVSSYCQELKNTADQLSNVGDKVKEDRLVLQLISGLNDSYRAIGTLLSFTKPLPSFYDARSMLILEEQRNKTMAAQSSENAGTALTASSSPNNMQLNTGNNHNRNNNNNYRGRCNFRGSINRGRGSYGSGRGRSNSGRNNNQGNYSGPQQKNWAHSGPFTYGSWVWQSPNWAVSPPPCPYPTTSQWPKPMNYPSQTGILGPWLDSAYAQSVCSTPTATNIEAAMHTMSLNPPDENWYLDTGATSHMAGSQGNLMF